MNRRLIAGFIIVICACAGSVARAQMTADGVIAKLSELTTGKQITDWKYAIGDFPEAVSPDFDDRSWRSASPEFQWGEQPLAWMRATVIIPERVGGFGVAGSQVTLRVGVDDDGECYVNGVLKQKFHWDECRVVLTEHARPGDKYVIVVKDINAGGPGRMLSASLEYFALSDLRAQVEQISGQLSSAKFFVGQEKDKRLQEKYRNTLDSAAAAVDLGALARGDGAALGESIAAAEKQLAPIKSLIKEYTLHLIGHGHIDMNWLWLWPETVQVCRNTFSTVLKLMDEFPEFRYSQSQAAAYLAVEEADPQLFARIQQRVRDGRWDITGGTWVEGDMNMPSGEAIVRQILYAKQYFREKFGVESAICWEPDTFGHAWTVPQILAKSGIEYYYFMRCGKGQPIFWWQSPDGSRVLACNTGSYNGTIDEGLMDIPLDMGRRYGVRDGMHVYGVGDHGGGPTRAQIRKAIELQHRTDFPVVKFDTTSATYATLAEHGKSFPVIRDELNFEFRGCYTSHSDIKKMNRVSENLLPTAEMFSVLAGQYGFTYPRAGFVAAWRNTCFNQFHDIFDGTAIHGSYEYSRQLFDKARGIGDSALQMSQAVLADVIDTSGKGIPVIVFNPLSWARTDVVRMDVPGGLDGQGVLVKDAEGREMDAEIVEGQLVFVARGVPSIGYKVFYLSGRPRPPVVPTGVPDVIENEFFRVRLDAQSGTLASVFDKRANREVLAKDRSGDLLQVLFESSHGMSAWNIGTIEKTEDLDTAVSSQLIGQGPMSVVRVKHRFGTSAFTQDIMLYPGVPRIDFKMTADWKEVGNEGGGRLLKVAFPVDVVDGKARFEIPFGSIERPANGDEVPAQKWIDVSNKDYGVSLLNDCKYGHDVDGSTMRMSLLRCSSHPDPKPDVGRHEITYSLYPHSGDWRKADTVRRGYELNNPLIPVVSAGHGGRLPKEYSFVKVEPSNVIVTSLKQAESSDDVILRFYECTGSSGTADVSLATAAKGVRETDLAERPIGGTMPLVGGRVGVPFGKWEIKTLRISD